MSLDFKDSEGQDKTIRTADTWQAYARPANYNPMLNVAYPSESDPNGLPMNVPGAKADSGKLRMALMSAGFALALKAVAEITTHGAKKYTPGGWRHVPDGYERYADAQQRHQNAHDRGERVDPDFNCYHLAHEAWNSLAKLELFLMEQESHANDSNSTPPV